MHHQSAAQSIYYNCLPRAHPARSSCCVCVHPLQTNFDIANRIPLVIRAAGQQQQRLVTTIVEAVDLYPTLASLAGLSHSCRVQRRVGFMYIYAESGLVLAMIDNVFSLGLPAPGDVDGVDLSSIVLGDSDCTNAKCSEDSIAYSEFPRCCSPETPWDDNNTCIHASREVRPLHLRRRQDTSNPNVVFHLFVHTCKTLFLQDIQVIGYSMRTVTWRCTLWLWWDKQILAGDFSRDSVAVELCVVG